MKIKEKTPLFLRTIALVKAIPKGKVMSYGQIADNIGAPGCGRHVSFILSSSSRKYKLPWHRVINSQGKVSDHGKVLKQLRLLKKEGLELTRNETISSGSWWRPTKTKVGEILKGIPKHTSLHNR